MRNWTHYSPRRNVVGALQIVLKYGCHSIRCDGHMPQGQVRARCLWIKWIDFISLQYTTQRSGFYCSAKFAFRRHFTYHAYAPIFKYYPSPNFRLINQSIFAKLKTNAVTMVTGVTQTHTTATTIIKHSF